jgi:signal transduction histidine kinase
MERGGTLRVRTGPGSSDRGDLVVEFADSGAGIPAGQLARIFEPFFTTKAPGRGTGLGLTICYGIIEEQGGRITVDSQPGRGTTFRVHLPVAPEARP